VCLGVHGAEKRSAVGEIDGLARTEQQLRRLRRFRAALRCGYFFTNLLWDFQACARRVAHTVAIAAQLSWVDPRDIGEIARQAAQHDWSGRHAQGRTRPRRFVLRAGAEILTQSWTDRSAPKRSLPTTPRSLRAVGMGELQIEGIVGM